MQIRSVGIDLGKTSFHLVALGDDGKVLISNRTGFLLQATLPWED